MSKQLIVNTKNSTKSITLKSLLISRRKKTTVCFNYKIQTNLS